MNPVLYFSRLMSHVIEGFPVNGGHWIMDERKDNETEYNSYVRSNRT